MTTMALASILSRSMTLIGTACGEVRYSSKEPTLRSECGTPSSNEHPENRAVGCQ